MGTEKLFTAGRIFFGISIVVLGFLTVYYGSFPYMMIPPHHSWIPVWFVYIFGVLLVLTGAGIVLEMKVYPCSFVLGSVLLAIFCFYFMPYQVFYSPSNNIFGDWENAAKELALAAGGLVVAGRYSKKTDHYMVKLLTAAGPILFSLTIISFAMDHFIYAAGAADFVPSWIPWRLFWAYFCGAALLAAGVAPIIKIQARTASILLGTMILIWFLILHVPRIIVSPALYLNSEIASAFLALAYSGIALMMAESYDRTGTLSKDAK